MKSRDLAADNRVLARDDRALATASPLPETVIDWHGWQPRPVSPTPSGTNLPSEPGSLDAVAQKAEFRVAERDSCRSLLATPHVRIAVALLVLAPIPAIVSFPSTTILVLVFLAVGVLAANKALRILVLAQSIFSRLPEESHADGDQPGAIVVPPTISVLVPLHDEQSILPHLIEKLSDLDYPRDRLDIRLLVESADLRTQAAMADLDLPVHIRILIVPSGRLRTKPRALNYALDQCRGSIVGIYDAEDAPEADQLWRVAKQFATAPPDVACLQGALDFYNTRTNWLSRCFTVEYASWYRVVLPALVKLGLPIPLGGTTLFIRKHILLQIGGWDAHNVTEDADLGMRLARYGFRSELVETTTFEEANCRIWPWVKQRSRWIKGYAITYLVQMRRPVQLLRQLGLRRFVGFQILILGSVLSGLLSPILLSFWIVAIGLTHPVEPSLSGDFLTGLVIFFIGAEIVTISIGVLAVCRTRHKRLVPWVPTLHLYYPLACLAAYRAIYELIVKPFHWDKTAHGLDDHHSASSKSDLNKPSVIAKKTTDVAMARFEPPYRKRQSAPT